MSENNRNRGYNYAIQTDRSNEDHDDQGDVAALERDSSRRKSMHNL
jgi:hypothetical protein